MNNDNDPATGTTLYGIDSVTDSLVAIGGFNGVPSPNGGAVTTIGALGVDVTDLSGLDVPLGASTTAFASLTVAGVPRLYSVNLDTGVATLVGAIGPTSTAIVDLAVQAPPTPPPPPVPPPRARGARGRSARATSPRARSPRRAAPGAAR